MASEEEEEEEEEVKVEEEEEEEEEEVKVAEVEEEEEEEVKVAEVEEEEEAVEAEAREAEAASEEAEAVIEVPVEAVSEAEEVATEEEGTLAMRKRNRSEVFVTNSPTHILFSHVHHHTLAMQILHTLLLIPHSSPHLHPNRRVLKRTLRTNQNQLLLRARERHVDPSPVLQQHSNLLLTLSSFSHVLLHVASHQRYDDAVLISALETVHRRHLQKAAIPLPSVRPVPTVKPSFLSYNLQYFRRQVDKQTTCAEYGEITPISAHSIPPATICVTKFSTIFASNGF